MDLDSLIKFRKFEGYIAEDSFRTIWIGTSLFAVFTCTILAFTGLEDLISEMKSLPMVEALGIPYSLFIFPAYLAISGAIGWKFWKREPDRIILPADSLLFHTLNCIFLFPALLTCIFSLWNILKWAFGEHRSPLDLAMMVLVWILFEFLIARIFWGFVRWTFFNIKRLALNPLDKSTRGPW
jgi:hypothetical protein